MKLYRVSWTDYDGKACLHFVVSKDKAIHYRHLALEKTMRNAAEITVVDVTTTKGELIEWLNQQAGT